MFVIVKTKVVRLKETYKMRQERDLRAEASRGEESGLAWQNP